MTQDYCRNDCPDASDDQCPSAASGSKAEALRAQFADWQANYGPGADDFMKDGIVCERLWDQAKRKVLFLLKEPNKKHSDFMEVVRRGPWHLLGHWAYGLCETVASHSPEFDDAATNQCGACCASAIVNLKKTPGGTFTEEMKAIEQDAQNHQDHILEEIRTISPDIVVCGGTFDVAKKIFPDVKSAKGFGPSGRCYRASDATWIDFCHPGARCSADILYYGLMHIFRGSLQ